MAASVDQTTTWEEQAQTGDGAEPSLRAHLFLALEGHRPLAAGARFDLGDLDEVVVGRGSDRTLGRRSVGGQRQLVVRVPDPWLSSLHARFRREAQGWVLEDAGSTNGSSIRGHRVSRASLQDGDLVEIGHCCFLFRTSLPTPGDTPPDTDLSRDGNGVGLATVIPGLAADYRMLERVGRSDVSVVLVGETGTGKEVMARALHSVSGRKGPFVAFNCGAIAIGLREGQLFGHVRGAFTGAHRDEPGFLRAASGGTLLLDEVVELDPAAQVALLRALQERQVVPVGSSTPRSVDVRFIAATQESLQAACDRGRFRLDLMARLDGLTYRTRPLRERLEDLGTCIAAILGRQPAGKQTLRIAPDAARALFAHGWPLNIRELEQCLVRAAALAEEGTIRARHLPATLLHAPPQVDPAARVSGPPKARGRWTEGDSKTRARVVKLLEEHEGNITEVARVMGKARNQVQRWLRRFEIDAAAFRRRR